MNDEEYMSAVDRRWGRLARNRARFYGRGLLSYEDVADVYNDALFDVWCLKERPTLEGAGFVLCAWVRGRVRNLLQQRVALKRDKRRLAAEGAFESVGGRALARAPLYMVVQEAASVLGGADRRTIEALETVASVVPMGKGFYPAVARELGVGVPGTRLRVLKLQRALVDGLAAGFRGPHGGPLLRSKMPRGRTRAATVEKERRRVRQSAA